MRHALVSILFSETRPGLQRACMIAPIQRWRFLGFVIFVHDLLLRNLLFFRLVLDKEFLTTRAG